MSSRKKLFVTLLLIVLGTSMHFVHHVPFFNHFLGYIFPVKESVAAHMKMVFYPMMLFGLCRVICRRNMRELSNCRNA